MKILKNLKYVALCGLFLTFAGCSDDEPSGSGSVSVEVTDAPVDNAEVQGVFVTVTDVKINGVSANSFDGTTTIDLLALQDGRTELLATEELNAGTYNNITFSLDLETDVNGDTPGAYVLTSEGKQALEMDGRSQVDLTAFGNYSVLADASNALVVDFDLRKLVDAEENGNDRYTLVTETQAEAALRLVEKRNAGTISGSINMSAFNDADKVIVYAYNRGTFNAEAETQGSANGSLMFTNAISSDVVATGAINNSFKLNFLAEGEYDLVFVAFDENETNNELVFEGFLDTDFSAEGEVLNTVTVEANATLEINLLISALIG